MSAKKLQAWESEGALTAEGVRALDGLRQQIVYAEREAADAIGMNAGELRALRLIETMGDRGVKALGIALGITTTGAAGFVTRLCENGFCERVPAVGQNNIPILAPRITSEGKKRVRKFFAAYATKLATLTEDLPPQDRTTFYAAASNAASRSDEAVDAE